MTIEQKLAALREKQAEQAAAAQARIDMLLKRQVEQDAQKKAQDERRAQQERARKAKLEREMETRMKVVLGAYVLSHFKQSGDDLGSFRLGEEGCFYDFLNERDRAYLGVEAPIPTAPMAMPGSAFAKEQENEY